MQRILQALALLTPVAATAGAAPAANRPADEFYVRAAVVQLDGGRSIENGVLAVRDGLIRAVGRGVEIPDGAAVLEHDGVLTAGIVSCASSFGGSGELHDPTRALLAEARAADAYDPSHSDFEHALDRGITAAVLLPEARNVAGGVTAVVRTDGSGLLEREAHLALSLTTAALEANREPTSYPGALRALEEELADPAGVWGQVASGDLPVLLYVGPRHEIARAVDFAAKHELGGALVGAPLAGELVERLAESKLGVVLGPFGPGASLRVIEAVPALAEAGVPFAFATGRPGEELEPVRFTAALCVRAGLDRAAAWRALTSDAARIAGVDDRIGSLAAGKSADFVLWTGDPLELTSSVSAVFVAGRQVRGGSR